jgi:hypothetical protein
LQGFLVVIALCVHASSSANVKNMQINWHTIDTVAFAFGSPFSGTKGRTVRRMERSEMRQFHEFADRADANLTAIGVFVAGVAVGMLISGIAVIAQ